MNKEKKHLIVTICVVTIIGLVLARYLIDPSLKLLFKDLIPNFISSLIIVPIVFFVFEVWGIKIDDREEGGIINKIKDGITEVIQSEKNISVFRSQFEANSAFLEKLDLKVNQGSRVQMIQYSSDYVLPIIKNVIEAGGLVELFIQNPAYAYDKHQEKKINGRLAEYTVNPLYKKAYTENRFHIYLYQSRPSIRAIKSEKMLLIGSYLYTDEVHGDDNYAIMYIDLSEERGRSALQTFKLQLEYLKVNSIKWHPEG